MAATLKRCLGVDIGSSRIKVAEIVHGKKGELRITRLLQADVDIPPGTDEDERSLRLTRALRDLIKANKIATKDAVFGLPGQSVFQRVVKLPKTSAERLSRIIEYEARQQIPFPLDQTRYEYQVFEQPDSPEEVEVLLAAIKKEAVSTHMRTFQKAGLKVAGVGVSYWALYNFHKFGVLGAVPAQEPAIEAAGDIGGDEDEEAAEDGKKKAKKKGFSLKSMFGGKKKKKGAEEKGGESEDGEAPPPLDMEVEQDEDLFAEEGLFGEVRAFVNLGASTMDLAIEKPGSNAGVGFCRSIPHAGNEMTKAIQRALEMESFGEAETLKRTKAAVKSTMYDMEDGDESYDSAASDALTKIVDRRIIGELRRSLDFYISQPDGAAVDCLVLSGGHTTLPYFANYMEEKLGVPVEIAEKPPEEAIEIADGADPGDWSAFTVAVGLALQGVGAAPIEIDFLPADIRVRREFKGKYKEVGVMAALLVAMVVMGSKVGTHRAEKYREIAAQLKPIDEAAINKVLAEVKELVDKRMELKTKFDGLSKIIVQRDQLLEFWSELLLEKPPELVFQTLEMKTNGTVKLWISCKTSKPILDFQENLLKRTDLIAGLDFQVPAGNPKTSDGQDLYYLEMINPEKYERLREVAQ